jgi:dienelactone hydrolase
MKRISILVISIIVWSVILSYATAATYDVEITPRDNFSKAAFRFWMPDNLVTIKGYLVLVPGINGDFRSAVNAELWQTFATKHNFAIVGCCFNGGNKETGAPYYQASCGSGEALFEAMRDFAEKSGHPEARTAPFVLWGFSAGGQFNYEFACWKPARVIAFVVNKGCDYRTFDTSKKTRNTPGVFFIGRKDLQHRIDAINKIFTLGRKQGALWTLTVEPDAGHDIGRSWKMAIALFDAVIPLRLPADGSAPLKKIEEESGWTGDLATFEISAGKKKTEELTSWLPNEAAAHIWQDIVHPVNDEQK